MARGDLRRTPCPRSSARAPRILHVTETYSAGTGVALTHFARQVAPTAPRTTSPHRSRLRVCLPSWAPTRPSSQRSSLDRGSSRWFAPPSRRSADPTGHRPRPFLEGRGGDPFVLCRLAATTRGVQPALFRLRTRRRFADAAGRIPAGGAGPGSPNRCVRLREPARSGLARMLDPGPRRRGTQGRSFDGANRAPVGRGDRERQAGSSASDGSPRRRTRRVRPVVAAVRRSHPEVAATWIGDGAAAARIELESEGIAVTGWLRPPRCRRNWRPPVDVHTARGKRARSRLRSDARRGSGRSSATGCIRGLLPDVDVRECRRGRVDRGIARRRGARSTRSTRNGSCSNGLEAAARARYSLRLRPRRTGTPMARTGGSS